MKLLPVRNKDLFPAVSLFDDFINSFFNDRIATDSKLMSMDVVEHDDKFEILADLPGIKREDLKVSVKGNELYIEAATQKDEKSDNGNIHRRERYSGRYQRVITLPENCDADNINAKLSDGVLSLEIPKAEPRPNKQITID